VAEVFRTPDDRFEGLPDFPFAPFYREAAGLRLAHLDDRVTDSHFGMIDKALWSLTAHDLLCPQRIP